MRNVKARAGGLLAMTAAALLLLCPGCKEYAGDEPPPAMRGPDGKFMLPGQPPPPGRGGAGGAATPPGAQRPPGGPPPPGAQRPSGG